MALSMGNVSKNMGKSSYVFLFSSYSKIFSKFLLTSLRSTKTILLRGTVVVASNP